MNNKQPAGSRKTLKQSYQKDKVYSFVVTDERNESGCQIVKDAYGIKHLLTGSDKQYPPGKSIRLVVRGFSHSPSAITGSYYLVLSPRIDSKEDSKRSVLAPGGCLVLPKKKKTGFGPSFLKQKYKVGERYQFVVTDAEDNNGRQFVEDIYGIRHILTGTKTKYLVGENVRCTVMLISREQNALTQNYCLFLTMPRVVGQRKTIVKKYLKSPAQWRTEVQGLDKHQSGRAFTCACCGLDFLGRMGYRVELKDICFCKSCASKIFEPKYHPKGPKLIYTPMGNKR